MNPPAARIALLIFLITCPGGSRPASTLGPDLAAYLPGSVAAWTKSGPDRVFGREEASEYFGATAEIVLGFAFRGLLVREYADGRGSRLAAEVYDMTTSADAFGLYSHDQDGEAVAVGQGGILRGGLLRFWKGPVFVQVRAERETEEAARIVLGLGVSVAAAIPREGPRSSLLDALPAERLERKSVRYFHSQASLNAHYYLADENVLLLGEETEVVLAHYRAGWSRAMLILCRYPSSGQAERARARFSRDYFSSRFHGRGEWQVEQIDYGEFAGAGLHGAFLMIVLEAPDRESCASLLRRTAERLRERFPLRNRPPA